VFVRTIHSAVTFLLLPFVAVVVECTLTSLYTYILEARNELGGAGNATIILNRVSGTGLTTVMEPTLQPRYR